MLPDSQSMLHRQALPAHLCSDLSPCFQLSGFCEPFAFLPPVPHHPPLSNPLIIFTTTAPTPTVQQLLCGCHTPKGALHTFPHVSCDLPQTARCS